MVFDSQFEIKTLRDTMAIMENARLVEVSAVEMELKTWADKCNGLEVRVDESTKNVLELSLMNNKLQDSLDREEAEQESKVGMLIETQQEMRGDIEELKSKISSLESQALQKTLDNSQMVQQLENLHAELELAQTQHETQKRISLISESYEISK